MSRWMVAERSEGLGEVISQRIWFRSVCFSRWAESDVERIIIFATRLRMLSLCISSGAYLDVSVGEGPTVNTEDDWVGRGYQVQAEDASQCRNKGLVIKVEGWS